MRERTVSVAVIGKGNQALRHIQIVRNLPGAQLHSVFYPAPASQGDLPLTNRLADLRSADAIIIASPTPTHAFYLQELADYGGRLLVEKPAVSTSQQHNVLRDWPAERKRRIKVNFNLAHSALYREFSRVAASPEIGTVIALDVHTSHGLAFKPAYRDSWRSKPDVSGGVLETVGVHYVNMALNQFGQPNSVTSDFFWAATVPGEARSSTPDTAILRLRFPDGPLVTFRHSYAAPFRHHWFLLGTNGTWEYDGHTARLRSPRDTFDPAGRFVQPPITSQVSMEFAALWSDSLRSAVESFVEATRNNQPFDPREFDAGLDAMELIREALRQTTRHA